MRHRIASDADLTRALLEVGKLVVELGFETSASSQITTAVSELGRNILKYAGAGQLQVERITREHHVGFRCTVVDKGPGIADLDAAMADHFSTSGTLGLGLPGVKRMMDEFVVESSSGKGTRVVITKWVTVPPPSATGTSKARPSKPAASRAAAQDARRDGAVTAIDWAVYARPCAGERASGDTVVVVERPDVVFIAIVDVLGHGPEAHEVARFAEAFLREAWTRDPVAVTLRLHDELKGRRGAAAGMALLDVEQGELHYVGVGNTTIRRFGARETRLHSVDGTLGQSLRSPRKQTMLLGRGDVLLLHTDGVRSGFKIDDYPQMRYETAKTIVRKVVEQFGRPYDDATCFALRYRR
jgi:anti-sigma regulatory factor (Ser/Thr protein kinase)